MAKKLTIGTVLVTDLKNPKRASIALGRKNTNAAYAKYDVTVELVVKDNTGKVVATQTDGWLNLVDPRTLPDELLKAGKIDEAMATKMRANAAKLSDKIKYQLELSSA